MCFKTYANYSLKLEQQICMFMAQCARKNAGELEKSRKNNKLSVVESREEANEKP